MKSKREKEALAFVYQTLSDVPLPTTAAERWEYEITMRHLMPVVLGIIGCVVQGEQSEGELEELTEGLEISVDRAASIVRGIREDRIKRRKKR